MFRGKGANISTFSFERAVVEVIAGALEIDVDDLWQRHVRAEEAKKKVLECMELFNYGFSNFENKNSSTKFESIVTIRII